MSIELPKGEYDVSYNIDIDASDPTDAVETAMMILREEREAQHWIAIHKNSSRTFAVDMATGRVEERAPR